MRRTRYRLGGYVPWRLRLATACALGIAAGVVLGLLRHWGAA